MSANRPQPKHIIISHVYSNDNKGDAALTSVLIADLRRAFPQASITIAKLEPVHPGDTFDGVAEIPSFMSYALNRYNNSVLKLAYSIYMMCATLIWASTGGWIYLPSHLRKIALTYAKADLIVPVGGGYIRSRAGLLNRWNIPLLLHPLLISYLLGKPTILYAQSVGPFVNYYERPLVAFALKRMTLVIVREDTSLGILASMGVTANVVRSIDSGFLLDSVDKFNTRKQYRLPLNKPLVGVTVRSWLAGEAQAAYELSIAQTLDTVIERYGVHVLFIPQVTAAKGDDDRLVSRRVHALMRHSTNATTISDAPDHHKIKSIYDSLDALIGTRFHSVIFSLTSYVPVLAIEYEHKTSGIMHDLALDRWVVKIEEATTQRLTDLMNNLMHERAEYRKHLRKHLPLYIRKAQKTVKLLEHSYYSYKSDLAEQHVD